MESLNQRIAKIIEYSGLTSSEFADSVEVQRSSISHITSGRNKPSLEFIIKLKNRFSELNWDWLIYGEGEMLKTAEEPEEKKPEPSTASLPDLFALIDDDNFGITEREDKVQKQIPRELPIPEPITEKNILSDSQPLEKKKSEIPAETSDNQQNKIKRIVIFFENGKFESFEP